MFLICMIAVIFFDFFFGSSDEQLRVILSVGSKIHGRIEMVDKW